MSPRPSRDYTGPFPPGLYLIRNAHCPTTVLDLKYGGHKDGTPVIGHHINKGVTQQWIFEAGGRGYRLKNGISGTYLSFSNSQAPTQGTDITGNRDDQAEWQAIKASAGYEFCLATNPDLVIDLYGWDTRNFSRICLYKRDGGENQQWNCELVHETLINKASFEDKMSFLAKSVEELQIQQSAMQDFILDAKKQLTIIQANQVHMSTTQRHLDVTHTGLSPLDPRLLEVEDDLDASPNRTEDPAVAVKDISTGSLGEFDTARKSLLQLSHKGAVTEARVDELGTLIERTQARVSTLAETLGTALNKLSELPRTFARGYNTTAIDNVQSLAATAWSTGPGWSGIRIYHPWKYGIAEICSLDGGFAKAKQDWTKGAFLVDETFNVPDETPIAAINTFDTSDRSLNVYFFTADDVLREWIWYRGKWKTGLAHSVSHRSQGPIRAITWVEGGINHRSVFYIEQGQLMEITRADSDSTWRASPIGPFSLRDFAVLVTIEESRAVKTVYTAGKTVMTFRGSWNAYESCDGKPIFAGHQLIGISLPHSPQSQKFYVTGSGTITEYCAQGGKWHPSSRQVGENVEDGRPLAVASQSMDGKTWIYIIHAAEGMGRHLSVTMHSGEQGWVPSIKITLR